MRMFDKAGVYNALSSLMKSESIPDGGANGLKFASGLTKLSSTTRLMLDNAEAEV